MFEHKKSTKERCENITSEYEPQHTLTVGPIKLVAM